jgi:hypothetical protein
MDESWDNDKRDILESYGVRGGRSGLQSAVETAGASSSSDMLVQQGGGSSLASKQGVRSPMSLEQSFYAQTILELNESRKGGLDRLQRALTVSPPDTTRGSQPMDLVTQLKKTAEEIDERVNGSNMDQDEAQESDVVDCWELIK